MIAAAPFWRVETKDWYEMVEVSRFDPTSPEFIDLAGHVHDMNLLSFKVHDMLESFSCLKHKR